MPKHWNSSTDDLKKTSDEMINIKNQLIRPKLRLIEFFFNSFLNKKKQPRVSLRKYDLLSRQI